MVDAGSIWIKLGLDTEELRFGIDKAKYKMQEWRGEMNQGALDLTKWGAAFAVPIAAATTMILTVNNLIQAAERYQDEIEQFSIVTGSSTESSQRWRAAAIATDTNFVSFTGTMQYLNATLGDTGTAGEELRSKLDSLQISYRDVNGDLVDNDTLMKNILTRLSGMESAQERDAAAKAILGRSWYNLAEMINDADKALYAYQSHSPAISDEDLEKIDEFKTKWAELAEQVELTKASLALPVMDALMGIEGAGSLAGVEISSSGMGYAGLYQYLTTGDKSLFDEAQKRIMDPGAYTAEAIQARAISAKGSKGSAAAAPGSFSDRYAGMSSQQLELAKIADEIETARANQAAAVTQVDYDKYSYELATLIVKQQELNETKGGEKDRVSALVDAYKEYEAAVNGVNDETKKLTDLNKDFAREMSVLDPRDVSAARNLMIRHAWAVEDQQAASIAATQGLSESATEFNAIRAGTPLDKIMGTTAYTEAQAKKSGDLIINIDGKQLAKIPGVATTEGKMNLMQRGIS